MSFEYTHLQNFINTLFPGWETMEGHIPCLATPRTYTRDGKEVSFYQQIACSGEAALQNVVDEPRDWYVCVSTVDWRGHRKVRRRKEDCAYLYAIMLDDIGTKAVAPNITPTAIVETSKGNFQYWYRLREPMKLTDNVRDYVERVYKALADAGFGDAGSVGVNRVGRVPGSVNSKPGREDFISDLTALNSAADVTIDEMVAATGITVGDISKKPRKVKNASVTYGAEYDPVVEWLTAVGERCEPGTGDFFTITCPWAEQHSDGRDEAGYSPIGHGSEPEIRGFKCLHEHCVDRSIENYLGWVSEQGGPAVAIDGSREADRKAAAKRIRDVMKSTGFEPNGPFGAAAIGQPVRREPEPEPADPPVAAVAHSLRMAAKQLSVSEAFDLICASMPVLSRNMLPDAVMSAQGGASKVQEKTSANIEWVLEECGMGLAFNMLTKEPELTFRDPQLAAIAELLTFDLLFLAVNDVFLRLGIKGTEELRGVLESAARMLPYHPGQVWLESLEWDEVDRIGSLADTLVLSEGVPKELVHTYVRKWLVQCVQAWCGWRDPQSMPYVLTLIGPQNVGKTSWFRSLLPHTLPVKGAFGEGEAIHFNGMSRKDEIERATRHMLVELGELDTTFKRSDAGALKAFLSNPEDRYRAAYARRTDTWPRMTIFGASVNDDEFLVDRTGSRRFMGVAIDAVMSTAGVDLEQVWAQSYALWARGESYWLTAEESALQDDINREHVMRTSLTDRWDTFIEQRELAGAVRAMTVGEIAEELGCTWNLSPMERRDLRSVVERDLGPRKARITVLPDGTKLPGQGKKRAWLVPVQRIGVAGVASAEKITELFPDRPKK